MIVTTVASKIQMDLHLLDLPQSTRVNRFLRSLMVFRGHTDWISPLAVKEIDDSKVEYWDPSQGRSVFSSSVFLSFRAKHGIKVVEVKLEEVRIDDGSTCFLYYRHL